MNTKNNLLSISLFIMQKSRILSFQFFTDYWGYRTKKIVPSPFSMKTQ